MVHPADLFPVGNLTSIDFPNLVRGQVLDGILWIDDKHKGIDSQWSRLQLYTQLYRRHHLISGNIPAGDNHVRLALDEIHIGSVRAAAKILTLIIVQGEWRFFRVQIRINNIDPSAQPVLFPFVRNPKQLVGHKVACRLCTCGAVR